MNSFGRSIALALVISATAAVNLAQSTAQDGDTPEYSFNSPLVNGRGMSSLADFRGKPVLVEFWGTR